MVPPPHIQGSQGGTLQAWQDPKPGQALCGGDTPPCTANGSGRAWGKGGPGECGAALGYLGSIGACGKAVGSGHRAWGEAIQPLDVQAGSGCAALARTGRPEGLRTDTSHDRSDALQTPGTQQLVALTVAGDTQGGLGRGQGTGFWAGILWQWCEAVGQPRHEHTREHHFGAI